MVLIATSFWKPRVPCWRAAHTRAMPPRAIGRRSSYRPRRVPGRNEPKSDGSSVSSSERSSGGTWKRLLEERAPRKMTQAVEKGPGSDGKTAPSAARAWSLAVVATLGMSVSYVDRQTLAAIAPSVSKALDIDNQQFGWLLSAFSFAYLVGAPIAGVVVDRLGSRRGFALAVLVWSVVAALHGLATSFGILFLLRVLLGAAESPSFPSAAQAIRRALPGARRPLAFGILFTGSSIGAISRSVHRAIVLLAEWVTHSAIAEEAKSEFEMKMPRTPSLMNIRRERAVS